jgi:PKD repeat protein
VYDNVGTYYQPALVFPENLANGAKYIAEACSHECGHNLGLSHDGTTTGSAYYSGHGSGETGWAPIMGVGYYQNVTQWSKGEYADANNTEDDLAVILSNGLSYRADDYGNDNNSATFLPVGTTISATGIIERNTDNDVIAFSAGAGTVTLNVSPASPGPNLDILALLYNATGTLISSNNPAGLACSFSASVPAGTYFLHIRGTGCLTPTNGYSSHASLGQYTVTGTVPNPSGAIAPVAFATATPASGTAPLSVNFSGSQSYDQDGSIVAYQWNFGDGSTGSGVNVAHTYVAGTYTATLTVTDNTGLTDSHSVTITASAPNIVPTAVVSATPTSGTAPLTVSFNGSGSYDADGSIASYQWNFGDGTTGSGATASHTYSAAGTYTATLTVTDNRGATASKSVVIAVQPNASTVVRVASISLSVINVTGGKKVQATVTITDPSNNTISGATVNGQWSGLISGTPSGTTGSGGTVVLTSGKFKKSGTVTLRVTAVSKSGYTYDASQNLVTQVSIAAAH